MFGRGRRELEKNANTTRIKLKEAIGCYNGDGCGALNCVLSGSKPIALIIKHHKLWVNAIFAGRQIN